MLHSLQLLQPISMHLQAHITLVSSVTNTAASYVQHSTRLTVLESRQNSNSVDSENWQLLATVCVYTH